MSRAGTILAAFLLSLPATALLGADAFDAWILTEGRIETLGHPAETRLPVGSLQKPFLVRAWARTHVSATPKFMCTQGSLCWRPGGHGRLDLREAIRESCNTYFRMLSADTPQDAIRASFNEAGLMWRGEMSEAETIGLPGPADAKVSPEQLIASYVDLARRPWPARDDVRQEMLSGLKDAVQDGTASGLRLWGFLAKTGTVPALDGAPLKTSGFAMVLDESGFAFLGLLRRGTGREAAVRAGAEIAKRRPGVIVRPVAASAPPRPRPATSRRALEGPLRVEMLGELRLREVRLKNIGASPVDSSRGFIGPGAIVTIAPGDRFSLGRWEILAQAPPFERRVKAAIEVVPKDGPLRLIATMAARDYANGILKAELGLTPGVLRTDLAAAALRFAAHGPRHGDADACDSTHCAWFVGEGPVPRWLKPDSAVVNEKDMAADLSDQEWDAALTAARVQPSGFDLWTADCGGAPASPHFIWGGPDRRVAVCPRHPKGSGRLWRRDWPAAELAAVFGALPLDMSVAIVDGQWFLKVKLASRESPRGSPNITALSYDEAHRRLASRLGWDSMPAPASRVMRTPGGFVAEGAGFGHRVGLCLRP